MLKKLSSMTVLSFLGTVLTFFYQTLCSHLMTVEDYGEFGIWLTDVGYLGMFFVLGLDSSILYHAKKGESYAENMGKNFVCYLSVFLLACLLVFLFNLNVEYYIPLFISILCLSISSVFKSYFHYQEKYFWFNVLNLIMPLGLFIVFGCFYVLLKNSIHVYSVFNYYAIISVGALLLTAYKYFKVEKVSFRKANIFSNINYFFYGFKSVLNRVLSLTLYASTVYCLNYFGTKEMVAYFFVASSISKLVWVLPDSAGNILYPRFLKIGTQYTKEVVTKEMFYFAQIVMLLNVLAVIVFFFTGKFLLNILYATEYQVVFAPILILLLGNQGMVYYKLLSRYLASMNNWKPLYLSLLVGVLLNLGLNALFIPLLGLLGAALATSISFIGCGLTISFFVQGSLLGFINVFRLRKV